MTTKMELLKRDLVKLANHLDQIGHRDLADRIDATITKEAGIGDYLSTAYDFYTSKSPSEVASSYGDFFDSAGSAAKEYGGATIDGITDVATYIPQETVNVYDTLMAGSALTDEEMYARQKRIDNRDYGTELGDWERGNQHLDQAGLDLAVALDSTPDMLPIPDDMSYFDPTRAVSEYDTYRDDKARQIALEHSRSGDIAGLTTGQRAAEADRAAMRQEETDRQGAMEAARAAELQASQAAQDAESRGASDAPSALKSWGRHYYPDADKAIVRAIQAKLGLSQDGQFGPRTLSSWNNQVGGPLPATAQAALDKANSVITSSMREDRLTKQASLEDRMAVLSNAFSSGIPANVRR